MMKTLRLLIASFLLLANQAFSQVAINNDGSSADASAMLDINSTTGGILIPRITSAQRNGISSPANGLMVYDTDTDSFWYYDSDNGGWIEIITSFTNSIDALADGRSNNNSIFLGEGAGINSTGSGNIGIGMNTLKSHTTGLTNTAVGKDVLYFNTTGSHNSAFGHKSLFNNISGTLNVAIGTNSLRENNTGYCNVAVGANSSASLRGGTSNCNVSIGYGSDYENVIGQNNTIVGYEAGRGTSSHNKSGSVFLGYQAGYNETTSNKLYIENSNSLTPLIGGDFENDSIFLNGIVRITGGSPGADKLLTSDADGNAIWETPQWGASALTDLSDASTESYSLFIGNQAGTSTTGFYNTGIGIECMGYNTDGNTNTAVGSSALMQNISGSSNIAVGYNSLYINTTGDRNIGVGSNSLYNNNDGVRNIAIGYNSLYSNITSDYNCAVGYESLKDNTGEQNTAFGSHAAGNNTTGSSNVTIGYASNYFNETGGNNTIIGYKAGRGTSIHNKTGNIFLGYQAGYNETASNKLYIENSDSDSPLIGGDFDSDEVYFNTTKLGIGTSDPREMLEVAGLSNGYGRIIVSDGGGDTRNALLFVSPTSSNQTSRIEAFNYGTGTGLTLNFNTTGNGQCVFGGNILPENHISKNLGASGQAWNNVYAHNYITQGSAAFSNVDITKELLMFPPKEKAEGAFDEYTEKGLKELDPASLPKELTEDNALLIDEMTTYNYKANYEQQLQMEILKAENIKLKARLDKLEQLISR